MEICVAKRSVLFYSLKLIKLKQVVELTLISNYITTHKKETVLHLVYYRLFYIYNVYDYEITYTGA